MKKDTVFFTAEGKGLTATSANHIANLAKEMIRDNEAFLEELTLYSTELKMLGTETPDLLKRGASPEELRSVPDRLRTIGEAKSLIAWLREAIAARDMLIADLKLMNLEVYAKEKGIELKEEPKLRETLTPGKYWATKSMDERCRYYTLEAKAAALGKAVHPSGGLASAREALTNVLKAPHKVEVTAGDALVYAYVPTVETWEVEDVYFRVQKQYRDVQSRLNEMKFECDKAVADDLLEARSDYATEMAEYTNDRKRIKAEMERYKVERAKEIGGWRIVIPDSLTEIYTRVSNLGKA